MSKPKGRLRGLFDLLFWPLLVCLALVSLTVALRWYFALDFAAFAARELHMGWLVIALLFQILIQVVVVLTWQCNLKLHGLLNIRVKQALTMIGINAIGKYSPGKIWGLVARGAALLKISENRQVVVLATLVDQIALVHSGVVLAALSYLYQTEEYPVLLLALVLTVGSVFAAARSATLFLLLKRWLDRRRPEQGVISDLGFRNSYPVVFVLMIVVWLLSAVVLHFCIGAAQSAVTFGVFDVLSMTVLAYLAGFLAFFSLAGLGVREGVMVALLSTQLDLSVAAYISVIHRLLTLAVDLLLGLVAFIVGRASFGKEEKP